MLIFIHKEQVLPDMQKYRAKHFAMIEDKLRILAAIKKKWKERCDDRLYKTGSLCEQRNSAH